MMDFFTILFYQPLFNLLIGIYTVLPTHDLGIAIIILTLLVKFVLAPFSWKQIVSQAQLQEIQPELERIKTTHKDDKKAQMEAQMKLFQERKINPLSSCLPLLIQLPFLIALFYVLIDGLNGEKFSLLYSFIPHPESFSTTFLGIFDLHEKQNVVLAVIVAGAQFIQTKMMMPPLKKKEEGKEDDMAAMMSKQMLYVMPVITGVMSYQFPNGLGLYWCIQTILSIAQQKIFFVMKKKRQLH